MHTFAQQPAPARQVPRTVTVPPVVHQVLALPGRPLDRATRHVMESRFGQDFSRVKIHADTAAAESAHAIGANAYTVGRNIVFGAGIYAPHTGAGQQLLGHELTHVLQQRAASSFPQALEVGAPGSAPEREADQMADAVASPGRDFARGYDACAMAPQVQREPTSPRASTGLGSIADLDRQTKGAVGKVTAGSLARMEWESLFGRHFAEPDKVEDEVESSHARYIYSNVYGWIDAQHFFAHIQFAEDSGLEEATAKGIDIETKQAVVRKLIGPDPDDTSIYSDLLEHNLISPADLLWYREGTFMAIAAAMEFLGPQEKALLKGFGDEKLAKAILDNAMSAWSYEDLVSNQLGVQFFRLHGAYVNAGKDAADVRTRFIDRMTDFFASIQVVNDAATIKAKGAKLPGKERWTSPKLNLADAKKKFPELFAFSAATHRLRVLIQDSQAAADKGVAHISSVAPSVPGVHVEKIGAQFAVYTGPVSHFEAILLRALLSRAIPINLKSVTVEPAKAAVTPKP
jgi:hypothetical protein